MKPVLVLRHSKPGLQTSRMKRLLDGRPGTRLAAPDGHRSAGVFSDAADCVEDVELSVGNRAQRADGSHLRDDRDAFAQIIERYQRVVYAVAFSGVRDRALSDDVTQDTGRR